MNNQFPLTKCTLELDGVLVQNYNCVDLISPSRTNHQRKLRIACTIAQL